MASIDGGTAHCHVRIAAPAWSTTYVTISPSAASGVEGEASPVLAIVGRAFPNPSRHDSRLAFSLAAPGRVRVDVLDVSGRLVRTLSDREHAAGTHMVEWDLRDGGGARAATGVYFLRVASGGVCATEKLVVLR